MAPRKDGAELTARLSGRWPRLSRWQSASPRVGRGLCQIADKAALFANVPLPIDLDIGVGWAHELSDGRCRRIAKRAHRQVRRP